DPAAHAQPVPSTVLRFLTLSSAQASPASVPARKPCPTRRSSGQVARGTGAPPRLTDDGVRGRPAWPPPGGRLAPPAPRRKGMLAAASRRCRGCRSWDAVSLPTMRADDPFLDRYAHG